MGRNRDGVDKKLFRLLLEYLKDSNRDDREVAKDLGVSQATVSGLKSKLIEEGFVTHFSAIPNLGKMGYEILAFSLVKFNRDMMVDNMPEIIKKAKVWVKSHSEILFDSLADGMGMDAVTISVHKNYAEYKDFLAQNKREWGKFMSEVHFILVDLNGYINKPFSFEYLAEEKDR
jgi:DNA-binding Lrp family transcriptional regulator